MKAYVDLNKAFLPDKEGCKKQDEKGQPPGGTRRWCHFCPWCTKSETKERALFGCGEDVHYNCRQQCCVGFGVVFFIYVFLFGIVQFICFHCAVWNCGSLPTDFTYSVKAGVSLNTGGKSVNIMPQDCIIKENTPTIWGSSMNVYPAATGNAIGGGAEGIWQRTWGPWFSTYVYQENSKSKELVYMRPTIMGMWFYTESVIMRCDGKGKTMTFSEGMHWMRNRIRSFFRMNQAFTYKMWYGDAEIGRVEETGSSMVDKSATFYNITQSTQFANAFYDTKAKQWVLRNLANTSLPFYLTNAMVTLYGFHVVNGGKSTTAKATPSLRLSESLDDEGAEDVNEEAEEHVE